MHVSINAPLRRSVVLALVLPLGLLLIGCGDSEDTPYLEFLGGGFVFNYRVGEAYYGFVVKARRRLPSGSVVEAEFENPSGGKPFIRKQAADFGRSEYAFRSPALHGVKKDRPYRVTVRLRKSDAGSVIAAYSRSFRSSLSQAALPVVRPGSEGCGPNGKRETASCVSGR
jgi:hypothetical protein